MAQRCAVQFCAMAYFFRDKILSPGTSKLNNEIGGHHAYLIDTRVYKSQDPHILGILGIARVTVLSVAHHITLRGNRRQKTFFNNKGYAANIVFIFF
jgi:hypothetical protein